MNNLDGFIADRVFDYDIMVGKEKPKKPGLIYFKNYREAINMLNKHINKKSKILVHCDIDMDGIGSGFIVHRFLRSQEALDNTGFVINKDKTHGIEDKHIDYINKNGIELVIILDSSSNELEQIKRINCDVLVIDHHEIEFGIDKEEFNSMGSTVKGNYIIINNMLNTNEDISKYMSGGMVTYELLRIYEEVIGIKPIIEKLKLYQWAAVTLISDMIPLNNENNQWYIQNTIDALEIEPCLHILLQELDKWNGFISKNFLSFKLIPLINGTIRAGKSYEALDIILNRPTDITELLKYRDIQQDLLVDCEQDIIEYSRHIIKEVKEEGLENYIGLIATRISQSNKKDTAVFINKDGILKGSFRGLDRNRNYREEFKKYITDNKLVGFALGHALAFGFKVDKDLDKIMDTIGKNQKKIGNDNYVTMGEGFLDNIGGISGRGKHHIDNLQEFKKAGLFWRLGIVNSRLSNEEIINITIKRTEDIIPYEIRGKAYLYNIYNLECIAFEELVEEYIDLYVEHSGEIKVYARNKIN